MTAKPSVLGELGWYIGVRCIHVCVRNYVMFSPVCENEALDIPLIC